MNSSDAFYGTNARAFRQCSDYRDLLVLVEDVCHRIQSPYWHYCITIIIRCQVFLCYTFLVMKWLIITVIILAQQPTKVPESKRSAKSNDAKSAAHTKGTEGNQTPSTQPTPALTQAPIQTESQRSSAAANEHERTSSQQTFDE